jgi:RNA polymerase sigma-70 factor, ECF subfamily
MFHPGVTQQSGCRLRFFQNILQPNQAGRRPTSRGDTVDNDQDLADVQRVLEGDLTAFEPIVRRWQNPLINLAFRFCRNRQRAEEMAQDAFLQVYRKLNKFRREASFSTWLFAISLNVFRSTMRRKSLPVESIDDLSDIAGAQLPGSKFDQEEQEELIRRAVTALPPKYRDPIIIFYFKEMNLAETAAILGMPEGTAKALLHRGRELLRRKLIDQAPDFAAAKECTYESR